jgi:hypothetical protein
MWMVGIEVLAQDLGLGLDPQHVPVFELDVAERGADALCVATARLPRLRWSASTAWATLVAPGLGAPRRTPLPVVRDTSEPYARSNELMRSTYSV